ncbi:MAG TPA: LysM peptidoglycan-binding domain-containing protein [Methylomirabilota bacterium]|nr:LysM peptidoglycan-binding domain-containing protein [Methylomirabilota bacterium]
MNSANPFQIPSCFQLDNERKRKERFKKAVIASVVAAALLLVGLLIQGCKSERSASSTPLQTAAVSTATPQTISISAPMTRLNPGVMPQPVPSVQKASMTPAFSQSPAVYVVKSGDTLTRIAKAHGISVKALRSANDLANDQIVVGAKLKIPTA